MQHFACSHFYKATSKPINNCQVNNHMKSLPFIILLAFCTAFPAYAIQRNLEITWNLPKDTGVTPEGYRLYLDGHNTPVCSVQESDATSMRCDLDLTGSSAVFTLTSYTGTTESPHSAEFEYIFETLPLAAAFSTNPSSGEEPLPVSFDGTASTGDITSYDWDFGDGAHATGQTVQHEYTKAGTYSARLTISDTNGHSKSSTTSINVTKASGINHSPVASIAVDSGTGLSPLTVAFDASGSSDQDDDILTYSWAFGDGSKGSGQTTTHTYYKNGTMHATLTVTDSHNATSTASVPITVSAPPIDEQDPQAIITMSPSSNLIVATPCRFSGTQSLPSAEDEVITSYHWDFGDGATASGEEVAHTFSTPGNYTITLTVRDSNEKTGQSTRTAHVVSQDEHRKLLFLLQVYEHLLYKPNTLTRHHADQKVN